MIEVCWFDEQQRALQWVFPEKFTLDDYHAAIAETVRLAGGSAAYDIVADVSQTVIPPQKFVTTLRNIHRQASSRYGMTIVYGANPMISTLLQMIDQVGSLKGKYAVVNTREDALRKIEARTNARTT